MPGLFCPQGTKVEFQIQRWSPEHLQMDRAWGVRDDPSRSHTGKQEVAGGAVALRAVVLDLLRVRYLQAGAEQTGGQFRLGSRQRPRPGGRTWCALE